MKLCYITGILEAHLNKTIMNITKLATLEAIDLNLFPDAPATTTNTGYRWVDGGKVILIPTEKYVPDYNCDPNTLKEDESNYNSLESNILSEGFDCTFEPAYVTYDKKTDTYSGKSGRTRHKIFLTHGISYYPVRLMEAVANYDVKTSDFCVSFIADISHKPHRELTWSQIAQKLTHQKNEGIAWYHGQTKNLITKEYVFGYDEYNYFYYNVGKIDQKFVAERMCNQIWNKIEEGFNSTKSINILSKEKIENIIKQNILGDGDDGFTIIPLIMDNASANAPSKLFSMCKDPNKKVRQILYSSKAKTPDEIFNLRNTWKESLITQASNIISFALSGVVASEMIENVKENKLKKLFANFELYGYNHIEGEEDFVKIDMFTKHF